MKFYTWKDLERYCLKKHNDWQQEIEAIDFYPHEIIVYSAKDPQTCIAAFEKLFPMNFDARNESIKLDLGNIHIPIYIEPISLIYSKPTLPLFKKAVYSESSYTDKKLKPLSKPVIAFHSYKGGVGRTLSLLAFAKAWSDCFANTANNKLLIIDSDIEAPGLTWAHGDYDEEDFSYLDLLTIIQDNTDINTIVDLACSKIGNSRITIETDSQIVEHIFIPTSRYDEQLLDIYASPETITNGKEKEYILAEVISAICERLGASAALVDLRAGISEHSATLLLDPRVKKYLVTSTSSQSIVGTKKLLEYLSKGLTITADTLLPEIFLNMVPENLPDAEKSCIINELIDCYPRNTLENEEDRFIQNVVTEFPFASELIHLTSIKQMLASLKGRDMYRNISKLVCENYSQSANVEGIYTDDERKILLEKINKLAESQIAAESNTEFDLLMTEPLKYLRTKYRNEIPSTVIMGAKGSGKTFLYRKLIKAFDWFSFCNSLNGTEVAGKDGYFLPVLCARNAAEIIPSLKSCVQNLNQSVSFANVKEDIYLDNQEKLEGQKDKKTDWKLFWNEMLASSLNPDFHTLEEVNATLRSKNKKIVFLIDGLEEYFRQVRELENESQAIQVLCQDIVNSMTARYENIGMVVFLRRDMAQDAISVNFTQFAQTYGRAELKWSSEEALRLAVWLVSQADKSFYSSPNIPLDIASKDIIDDHLIKLWGLKLGKTSSNEAYSSRWILAALSDFNGQLQARDIIRFLKYATESPVKKAPYNERILMPKEIRDAVSKCSIEKIEEVKLEYSALKPIFEKLDGLPSEQKVLPLIPHTDLLNGAEEKAMIQEGYLIRDGEKYYLPEIVRHALKFKYEKGARPKVLSLLLKR